LSILGIVNVSSVPEFSQERDDFAVTDEHARRARGSPPVKCHGWGIPCRASTAGPVPHPPIRWPNSSEIERLGPTDSQITALTKKLAQTTSVSSLPEVSGMSTSRPFNLSRRRYLTGLAAAVGYGYATRAFGKTSTAKESAPIFPARSVLLNCQLVLSACCNYSKLIPISLEPEGRYLELFVTPPGEAERSITHIPGSEILANGTSGHWGGTYPRTSNPTAQGAKGVHVVRLRALTYKNSVKYQNCCQTHPSLEIDASYSVLINGEQNPSLPAPYGSFTWYGQELNPMYQESIWTFNVS
jgi:hypothetical protein